MIGCLGVAELVTEASSNQQKQQSGWSAPNARIGEKIVMWKVGVAARVAWHQHKTGTGGCKRADPESGATIMCSKWPPGVQVSDGLAVIPSKMARESN